MPADDARDDTARLFDHRLLRAWREECGYTREQVCVTLGIGYPWLTQLEGGGQGRIPSLQLLTRLAELYGHQASELLMMDRSA